MNTSFFDYTVQGHELDPYVKVLGDIQQVIQERQSSTLKDSKTNAYVCGICQKGSPTYYWHRGGNTPEDFTELFLHDLCCETCKTNLVNRRCRYEQDAYLIPKGLTVIQSPTT